MAVSIWPRATEEEMLTVQGDYWLVFQNWPTRDEKINEAGAKLPTTSDGSGADVTVRLHLVAFSRNRYLPHSAPLSAALHVFCGTRFLPVYQDIKDRSMGFLFSPRNQIVPRHFIL